MTGSIQQPSRGEEGGQAPMLRDLMAEAIRSKAKDMPGLSMLPNEALVLADAAIDTLYLDRFAHLRHEPFVPPAASPTEGGQDHA